MVRRGVAMRTGAYFLRNFLFRIVTPRSVDSDYILVELTYFDDLARFVPLRGVRASLILYSHEVADDEGW